MLIDFHTHAFPDGLAEKSIPKMAEVSGLKPFADGTVSDLAHRMDEWGVDHYVVLNIAVKPNQSRKVNDFALSAKSSRVSVFGSVHPDDDDAEAELERIKSLGAAGVKLHPDYQKFFADDSRLFGIYEKCSQLELPICFHAGFDPVSPDVVHCTPQMLRKVADLFPGLTIIGAHLGGMNFFEDSEKYLAGTRNVYLDVSMVGRYLKDRDLYLRIIKKHGADRVLFGSDCPWSSPAVELKALKETGLGREELDRICYMNAAELLRIN